MERRGRGDGFILDRPGSRRVGLRAHELAVRRAAHEQLRVCADAGDLAGVEHDDLVGLDHGAEPVRDHDPRAVERAQLFVHSTLGRGVERAGGFVQDQQRRLAQQRARQRQALALSARQRRAAVREHRVVAHRHLLDRVVQACEPAGVLDAILGHLGVEHRDVVADRGREQPRFLGDDPEAFAQRVQVPAGDLAAVDRDAPRERRVQSGEQPRERGLARAGSADNRDALAGRGVEADVGEHRARLARIGEREPLHEHVGGTVVGRPRARAGPRRRRLARGVEHVLDPLHVAAQLGQPHRSRDQVRDRLEKAGAERRQAEHRAERERAVQHLVRAHQHQRDRSAEAKHRQQRVEGAVEHAARDRAVERAHVQVAPALSAAFDRAHRLHGLDRGEQLDLIRLEPRLRREPFDHEPAAGARRKEIHEPLQQRETEGARGQKRRGAEQEREVDRDQRTVEQRRQRSAREQLADRGLAAHAHHQVAGRALLEERIGQIEQVVDEGKRHLRFDLGAQLEQKPRAQQVREKVERRQGHARGRDQVQQAPVTARHHLVDDDAHQGWRREREQLQHERSEQDAAPDSAHAEHPLAIAPQPVGARALLPYEPRPRLEHQRDTAQRLADLGAAAPCAGPRPDRPTRRTDCRSARTPESARGPSAGCSPSAGSAACRDRSRRRAPEDHTSARPPAVAAH